jgi:hypothetical protein
MPTEITRMSPKLIAENLNPSLFEDAHSRGLNVSQLLEHLDPTAEYPESERHLDAFERVTEQMGIVTRSVREIGLRASTYEDVTRTPQGKAWFTEFAARTWRQAVGWVPPRPDLRAILSSGDYALGTAALPWADDLDLMESRLQVAIPLSTLIAGTREIEGDAYRSIYISDSLTTDAYRLKRVAEGAEIPATSLITGERYLRIHKYGRAIKYTYEQMRRQRLDRIAFLVARIALVNEADKVGIALDTIVSGDGNANTAAVVYALTDLDAAAAAGTLTLAGWQSFKNQFYPYIPSIVLGQDPSITQLQNLPLSTGNSIPYMMAGNSAYGSLTPINPTAWNMRYGIVATAPALKLIAFDPNWAVEQVSEIGSTISELERYINNQTWMLTMTETNGFGTIDPSASRVLNINA